MIGGGGSPWGPIIGAIAGGVMGIEKHYEDRQRYKQDQKLAQASQRWSPWAQMVTTPEQPSHQKNVLGSAILGAQAGSEMNAGGLGGITQDTSGNLDRSGGYQGMYRAGEDIGALKGDTSSLYGDPGVRTDPRGGSQGYTLNDEMQQEVEDEKKKDRQLALARQNPWFAMMG